MPNTSGSTYQKVVTIAPNLTSTAVKYTVVVTGLDNAGNSGHSATLTFSVPASDVPPPPPGG